MLLYLSLLSFYSINRQGANFQNGDNGAIQISALTSDENLFPIDLTYLCDNLSYLHDDSLGTNLIGKKVHTKSYEFPYSISKKSYEYSLCSKEFSKEEIEYLIQKRYRLNFNLNRFKVRNNKTFGLKLGEGDQIFNHFNIYVHYQPTSTTGVNEVTSITGISESKKSIFSKNRDKIQFSFKIQLTQRKSEIDDSLYESLTHQIVSTLLIFVNVIIILAVVYFSTKKEEGENSNENPLDFEENFWYFMRGDIFRKPKYLSLLCSLAGIGFQLMLSAIFASFFRYSSEATLLHFLLFFVLLFSVFSGFFSVRLFKISEGSDWRTLIGYNMLLLPVAVLLTFAVMNLIFFEMNSSCALSIQNILKIGGFCFCNAFLSLIGSVISLTVKVPKLPFKVNLIPKQHVRQPFYLRGLSKCLSIGLFVTLNICPSFDLILRMSYGLKTVSIGPAFALECLLLLLLSSFAADLVVLYFSVKKESYNWWWTAFLGPASCGAAYLIAAIFYFVFNSLGDFDSFVVFLLSNAMIAAAFAAAAGFCGFWSCFMFLRLLYGSFA